MSSWQDCRGRPRQLKRARVWCSMGWIRDERWHLFPQPVGNFKASVGVSFHDVTLFHGITIYYIYNIYNIYIYITILFQWLKSLEHCRVTVCTEQGNFGRVRTATRWARGPPGACFAATSREGAGLLMSLVCFYHVFTSISFNYFNFKSFHSQRCQDTWKSIRIEHVGWPVRNFQRSDNGKVMQGDSRWCKVYELSWICWNMPRWEERQKVLRQELVKSRTWMRVSEWGNGCS